jgi:predicted DCC family thiol-disulfide oxidoreductase YuxK
VLCNGFARFVAKRVRSSVFRFTQAQSPLGGALFRHYGLDDKDFETNLLIEDGLASSLKMVSPLDGCLRTHRA